MKKLCLILLLSATSAFADYTLTNTHIEYSTAQGVIVYSVEFKIIKRNGEAEIKEVKTLVDEIKNYTTEQQEELIQKTFSISKKVKEG